jgi:hypothetical protein
MVNFTALMTEPAIRSRSRHRAFFDIAQNEDEFDFPSMAYLVLGQVDANAPKRR